MSKEFDRIARDESARFVALFFRLFKLAKMHDLENDASQRAVERGVAGLAAFFDGEVQFLSILFAGETVYVNGGPLQADRGAYENAIELGGTLDAMGFNELTVRQGVSAEDILELLRAVAKGERPRGLPKTLRLREVDPKKVIGDDEDAAPLEEQVISTYAAAVMLMKRFNEGVIRDDFSLTRHIKRVSQRMVTLSEAGLLEWLALVRRPLPPTDKARIAVHSAIIGLLAGRALTRDLHAMLRITMACMKGDVGRPRVVGMYRDDAYIGSIVPAPNEEMRHRIPASTSAILLQTGRAALPALKRTIVTYEAVHLSDGKLLGWPYARRIAPTVEGVIAAEAMRIAAGFAESSGPDELAETIYSGELGKIEEATADLRLSILGLTPRGTAVELESGHSGVVLSAGPNFHDLEHPEVVLLLDSAGAPIAPFKTYSGGEHGWIAKTIHEPEHVLTSAYERYVAETEVAWDADVSITRMPDDDDSVEHQSTLVFNPDRDIAGDGAPEFFQAIWGSD